MKPYKKRSLALGYLLVFLGGLFAGIFATRLNFNLRDSDISDRIADLPRTNLKFYASPAYNAEIKKKVNYRTEEQPLIKNRSNFFKMSDERYQFVYLLKKDEKLDGELGWQMNYLKQSGFLKKNLLGEKIKAYIFSPPPRHGNKSLPYEKIALPGPQTISNFVSTLSAVANEYKLKKGAKNLVENALIAKVDSSNTLTVFRKSNKDRASSKIIWPLGPGDWEYVGNIKTSFASLEREVIWAHPYSNETLIVGFPKFRFLNTLKIEYGIADSGTWNDKAALVRLVIFIDNTRMKDLYVPNNVGFEELLIDTNKFKSGNHHLFVIVTTSNNEARHFCFNLRAE